MAYFSGNAVYIRVAKNDTDYAGVCGSGILIDNKHTFTLIFKKCNYSHHIVESIKI